MSVILTIAASLQKILHSCFVLESLPSRRGHSEKAKTVSGPYTFYFILGIFCAYTVFLNLKT
jgi:hypothetical protein